MELSQEHESDREQTGGRQGQDRRGRGPALDELANVSPSAESTPSIGGYLSMQRELRGITRKELCQQTQIPLRSLERLESGAFDGLDDGFVRGFVRTVADALGLDLDDTLARMSPEPTSPTDSAGIIAGAGLARIAVLVAGLALVLVSVGLVSVALQMVPGQNDASPLVLRRDPVRALAEARGGSSFSATQAMVRPIAQGHEDEKADPSLEPGGTAQPPRLKLPASAPGSSLRAAAQTPEP